jgi:hypothetical protein
MWGPPKALGGWQDRFAQGLERRPQTMVSSSFFYCVSYHAVGPFGIMTLLKDWYKQMHTTHKQIRTHKLQVLTRWRPTIHMQGPEIRTGTLKDGKPIQLTTGQVRVFAVRATCTTTATNSWHWLKRIRYLESLWYGVGTGGFSWRIIQLNYVLDIHPLQEITITTDYTVHGDTSLIAMR